MPVAAIHDTPPSVELNAFHAGLLQRFVPCVAAVGASPDRTRHIGVESLGGSENDVAVARDRELLHASRPIAGARCGKLRPRGTTVAALEDAGAPQSAPSRSPARAGV